MRIEFSEVVRLAALARSRGNCESCGKQLLNNPGSFHFDHVIPAWFEGEAALHNCMVLCRHCHSYKTIVEDVPRIAKTKRQKRKHQGTWRASRRPVPGSKRSKWKKPLRGKAELRG